MPSAYETAATGIKAVIDAQFNAEGFTAIHDCLHESLGQRSTAIGISPIRKVKMPRNQSVEQTFIWIQFYWLWKREISPETLVNPFTIAEYAERLEVALEAAQATVAGTNAVWYYNVDSVEFPRDPTGNKSRFEMTVRAFGDTPGLETRA